MDAESVQPNGEDTDNTPVGEQEQQQHGEPQGTEPTPEKGEDYWKSMSRKNEAALKREREARKELEAKVKSLITPEEVQTKEQALAEKDRIIAELQTRDLKRKIGAQLGLPENMWDRLQGSDEDSIREDAEALKPFVVKSPSPAADAKKGTAGTPPPAPTDPNELLRQIIASR